MQMQGGKGGVRVEEETRNNGNGEQQCATSAQCPTEREAAY